MYMYYVCLEFLITIINIHFGYAVNLKNKTIKISVIKMFTTKEQNRNRNRNTLQIYEEA